MRAPPSQDLLPARVTPRPDRAAVLAAVVSAGLGVLALLAFYNLRAPLRLSFDEDHAPPPRVVSGAGRAAVVDGQRGVWITTRVVLNLRGLDRRVAWRLALDVRARAHVTRRITLWADGAPISEHLVADRMATIEHVVAADRSERGLVLAVFAASPTGRADEDDAFLSSVRAVPEGLALPPRAVVLFAAFSCGCLGLWLAWLAVPRPGAVAAVAALAVMNALAALHGLAAHTSFATVLLATDCACLAAVWALRAVGGRGLVAAGAVTAVALHVQLLVLLNPGVTHGDTLFHVHRLQVVDGGQLFFLSSGPGGEFPYPPALYVAALFLQRLVALATEDALRVTVAATTAGAGLIMYAVAAGAWGSRRALFGLALYHALPIALGLQALAFMTNAFGNALAAASLMLVGWSRGRGSAWTSVALAATCAAGAMLAHVSSAVILAGALAAVALLCLRAGDRTGARIATVVLVVSGVLAWTTYYSHPRFRPVYGRHASLASRAAADRASGDQQVPPPAMRAEAHQTRWVPGWPALAARASAVPGYVRRYFGLAGTGLAALGILTLAPLAGTRLDRVVAATLAACAAFLCLGVATPLDLRYYAAAYPFVAFTGGLGADRRPSRLPWLPRALLGAAIAAAALDWYRWLHTADI